MACTPCQQVRSDLTAAVKAGQPLEAMKIATKGLKMLASAKKPSVTRNLGR